jgi:hypothetical protein
LKTAEKLASTCFIENELLWTRIFRHREKTTILMVLENVATTLMAGIQGDMLYRH